MLLVHVTCPWHLVMSLGRPCRLTTALGQKMGRKSGRLVKITALGQKMGRKSGRVIKITALGQKMGRKSGRKFSFFYLDDV